MNIYCPNCENACSEAAPACPKCGHPLKKRKETKEQHWTRRAFIWAGGGVATYLVGKLAQRGLDKAAGYSNLLQKWLREIPDVRRSRECKYLLTSIFDGFDHYTVVPGNINADFPEGLHPDIGEPLAKLVPLWVPGETVGVKLSDLPEVAPWAPQVLIGGPVSNLRARNWQGYDQDPSTGSITRVRPRISTRWRFNYPLGEPVSAGPARYVNGTLHRSRPQEIVDRDHPRREPLRAALDPDDGFMTHEWLILSYVPNTIDRSHDTNLIDASDLHGQGNKAFAQLFTDPGRLDELHKKLKDKKIERYFQALYRVEVKHDHEKLTSGVEENDYHLEIVAPVTVR